MQTQPIDGRRHAERLLAGLALQVAAAPVQPGLAVVLVGEDAASQVYVSSKARQTVAVGMRSFVHRLDAGVAQAALLALVAALNADASVHGILVQLPLPSQIDGAAVLDAIDPAKDVDGFHVVNAGRLALGLPGLVPCTPLGCCLLLKHALGNLAGRRAVVIGRSNIVGKPMAQLLLREDCTVTVVHSRSADVAAICREADILVAAAGRPEMVRGDWIRPGATVIDVGINRVPAVGGGTRLVGDVCWSEAQGIAAHITPVPGGVGPMTIAMLLQNTLAAALEQQGRPRALPLAFLAPTSSPPGLRR